MRLLAYFMASLCILVDAAVGAPFPQPQTRAHAHAQAFAQAQASSASGPASGPQADAQSVAQMQSQMQSLLFQDPEPQVWSYAKMSEMNDPVNAHKAWAMACMKRHKKLASKLIAPYTIYAVEAGSKMVGVSCVAFVKGPNGKETQPLDLTGAVGTALKWDHIVPGSRKTPCQEGEVPGQGKAKCSTRSPSNPSGKKLTPQQMQQQQQEAQQAHQLQQTGAQRQMSPEMVAALMAAQQGQAAGLGAAEMSAGGSPASSFGLLPTSGSNPVYSSPLGSPTYGGLSASSGMSTNAIGGLGGSRLPAYATSRAGSVSTSHASADGASDSDPRTQALTNAISNSRASSATRNAHDYTS
ncbi:hypothetical protein IE81DRAFT_117346 [Ceraceosorus guamensis]|uniref:SCP domain-containing protein n=1 Tax=Ceraceosorus guamensis TaxID=1522189 RepID=A0A316W266_9BASI|nr:hypothetical protein IE81DRAFT_117346 [Ceraceosorus guamensis]PWN42651.1 hypothetical protein IE81DRAFT_117346 [Ceraceosorus guamensis]